MKHPAWIRVLTGLLILMANPWMVESTYAQKGPRYPVPVGAVHPDFKLPDVSGGPPVSLSDFRGKKVLLVHFASW